MSSEPFYFRQAYAPGYPHRASEVGSDVLRGLVDMRDHGADLNTLEFSVEDADGIRIIVTASPKEQK